MCSEEVLFEDSNAGLRKISIRIIAAIRAGTAEAATTAFED
jgi:hypothetical protein